MHILKALILAFSTYSGIPVPQFAWTEEDRKYMLCFFPWIGAVIGGCVYFWNHLCDVLEVGVMCRILTGTAIPIMLTGGFHADGFMDTMDAFHSYRPKEKKLEILQDSHIGAFAVIRLVLYGMLYMAAFSEITDKRLLAIVCAGFFLARCLSGISVISFPSAKQTGMLYLCASNSRKLIVLWSLYLQSIACIGFMLRQSLYAGMSVAAAAFLAFVYYYKRTKKELGGITGDTAGYFVLICEVCMMSVAAVINVRM